jgi:DNA repair protein RadD
VGVRALMLPRPYQTRGIDEALAHIQAGRRRVLLVGPTGCGKTTIAAELVTRTLPGRVYLLAHRKELLSQPYDRFKDAGVPAHQMAVLRGGRRTVPSAPVQICSVSTIGNRDLPAPSLVVIDEAHRTLAAQYMAVLSRWPGVPVVGLTATPVRTDRRGLGEAYDALVEVATYSELVADGYLVMPTVLSWPRTPDLEGVRTVGGEFDQRQLAEVCDRSELIGDAVESYSTRAPGRRAIGFAASVEHSRHLTEAFQAAGWRALHVDGTTPDDVREGAWKRLAGGELDVVWNYGVAVEGVDVPEAEVAIFCRPTQSLSVWLQGCGRISRPAPGKPGALVLDHAGNGAMRFGHPATDRPWSLEAPPKRKRGEQPHLTPCWTCPPPCGALVPATERYCPECWAERPVRERAPIKQREGELVELRPEAADPRLRELEDEWRTLRTVRGEPFSRFWIRHAYRERYGMEIPKGYRYPKPESEVA